MSHSENKKFDSRIPSIFNSYNNEGVNNINNKNNNNHFFAFDASPNLFKKNNSYLKTNLDSIKNVPILSVDNFMDVLNECNNYEKKNNTKLNDNNIENNKIIQYKIKIGNGNEILNNKEVNKEMNEYDKSKYDNLNDSKQIEILENCCGNQNNKYIKSNHKENDKYIEELNIPKNFPEDNSNNTINTFGDDDEKDKNFNNNYINNILIDKYNKNASIVDIDTISENRSNSPEANLNYYNNKEIKNINIKTNTNDIFPIPFNKKNSYSQFSPFHLPSNDSKKEIINSNSNNFNFKDNYSSPDSNVISPIIKVFSNSDSNEVKSKINIPNILNNNYENNISSFGKNSIKSILPFIQEKEKEYLEKFGSPKNIGGGKNFKIQKSKNNNNIIINKWKKFANYLKKKNLDLTNDINIEKNYIINSLIKTFKKDDKSNDNNYNGGNDNSIEPSETKIVAYTQVKELSNSNDNINEDNNIDNNNNNNQLYDRQESNKNWNYNIKEIFHGNDNEPNYEATNLNYINRLNFRKILNENKFNNLIKDIYEFEKKELEKMHKEDELNNKNKKEIMYTIAEDDDESKYDQDSLKESRKNSNFSKSKIIKNDEGIKIRNSSKNVSKNNSMNIEVNRNKNLNLNDIISGKNKNNYLSLSDNNIELNENSPKNKIDISYNNNKEDKNYSIYDENTINKNDINNLSDIIKYDYMDKNNQNIEESKVIKNNKTIHPSCIDNKKIQFNLMSIKDQLKEINKKHEEYSNKNVNNINIELNSTKTKSHTLFENILKNEKNNSDSDDSKKNYNIYFLFNQPYKNSQFNFEVNENNFTNKSNSHNMNININVNIIPNNNKNELNNDQKDKKNINLIFNKNTQNPETMKDNSNPVKNSDNKKKSIEQIKLSDNQNQNKNLNKSQSQNINYKNQFDNIQTNNFFYANNYLNSQNNVYNPFNSPNLNSNKSENIDKNEEKDKDKDKGIENENENIIMDKDKQNKLNENEIHINYNNKKDSGIINNKIDINSSKFENKEKISNLNMDDNIEKNGKKNDKDLELNEENNNNEKMNQIKDSMDLQNYIKIKQNAENKNNEDNNENNEEEAPIFTSDNKNENNSTNINNHIKINENNNVKEKEYDFDIDDEDNYTLLNNKENNDNKNKDMNSNDIDNNKSKNSNGDIYTEPENHIFESEDNNIIYNNQEEIINNEKSNNNEKLVDNKKSNNLEIHDNIQTTINFNNKTEKDNNDDENLNINNEIDLNNNDNASEGNSQESREKIILNISNLDSDNDTSKYNQYIKSPKSYKDNEDHNESKKEENNDEEMDENGNEIILIERKDSNNNALKYISNEQINNIKNYIDYVVDLNDDEVNKNYLKYIILDKKKKNKILFTNNKNINNRNKIYSISLSSYLLILNKISLKRKPINKIFYESFIKKLINKTDFHKKEIEAENNLKDSSIDISEDTNEELNLLFSNLGKSIDVLRDHYIHYMNNEKKNNKNEKDLKELENFVNIPQKRENIKNIYKDLIKYINNIYKNAPKKKINCYKIIIKYLKGYEKLNDGNAKNRKKINRENINRKKSKLDIIKNDNKDNNNWQIVNKRFNLLMIMGGVVLPLCYLIKFLNSNLK